MSSYHINRTTNCFEKEIYKVLNYNQFTLEGMFCPKKPNLTSPLYISACIGWYFTHMLKALTPHHFNKSGGFGSINILTRNIQSIKLYHLNYKEQNTLSLLLLLLLLFIINIIHGKKKQRLSLNNDRHQYQQKEQPSLL
jgi:hypothetical protein